LDQLFLRADNWWAAGMSISRWANGLKTEIGGLTGGAAGKGVSLHAVSHMIGSHSIRAPGYFRSGRGEEGMEILIVSAKSRTSGFQG